MAHTYLLFDFGTDEEKAQLARHKLEGWKQAFRLDKKLQYKLERAESQFETKEAPEPAPKAAAPTKAEKAKANEKAAKGKAKSKSAEADTKEAAKEAAPTNGKVHLLVRLYFSGHEKLTEQRWLDRIPSEEPFKEASPKVVRQSEPQFEEVVKQFESLQ